MTPLRRLFVTLAALCCQLAVAQTSVQMTNQEPASYDLASLAAKADTVALVKIVASDTESYNIAIYKAEMVKVFKGPAAEQTLYFGPYAGLKLGSEYIVFLRTNPNFISPKAKSTGGYGAIRYSEDFDQGYASMEVSYQCVFDGNGACDYGVRVCTDYIKLPDSVPAFSGTSAPAFGCRWARKTEFLAFLEGRYLQDKKPEGTHSPDPPRSHETVLAVRAMSHAPNP
jgi:hypothetical protein